MGKKLALLVVGLMFLSLGCQAFKDHYNTPPELELEDENLAEDQTPVTTKGASADVADYSLDKTPCPHVSGLLTSMISEVDENVNDGWTMEGEKISLVTEKKGPHTSKVVISKGVKQLAFTLKQVGKDAVHVCDVVYEDCVGECIGVKSLWSNVKEGVIEVYQLNKEDGTEVLNAGYYGISFDKSNMGDNEVVIEGNYFSDILGKSILK